MTTHTTPRRASIPASATETEVEPVAPVSREQILVQYIEVTEELIPTLRAARRRTLALLAVQGRHAEAIAALGRVLAGQNAELATAVASGEQLASQLAFVRPGRVVSHDASLDYASGPTGR